MAKIQTSQYNEKHKTVIEKSKKKKKHFQKRTERTETLCQQFECSAMSLSPFLHWNPLQWSLWWMRESNDAFAFTIIPWAGGKGQNTRWHFSSGGSLESTEGSVFLFHLMLPSSWSVYFLPESCEYPTSPAHFFTKSWQRHIESLDVGQTVHKSEWNGKLEPLQSVKNNKDIFRCMLLC